MNMISETKKNVEAALQLCKKVLAGLMVIIKQLVAVALFANAFLRDNSIICKAWQNPFYLRYFTEKDDDF